MILCNYINLPVTHIGFASHEIYHYVYKKLLHFLHFLHLNPQAWDNQQEAPLEN